MSSDGQKVPDVPYRVGRLPRSKEHGAGLPVHLQLPDKSPFRLSRFHFALVADGDGYAVRDEGSHLGTTVNGVLIGQHAGRSLERLKPGENTVVAGGQDSPFAFRIVLESA
jgi:pSer/pThr/pTyr-binding forkhead associated (FHA) protein